MVDRGARATRKNGPVENSAVNIAEVVNNHIDLDSDSSSDNELLVEVVIFPHGSGRDHRQ